jgi:TRAP-type C4-dicarboxylate transport system permease small subunit
VAGLVPPALARWVEIAATVVGLAITGFLTSALAGLTWSSLIDGSRTFTATATPLVIPQAAITLGAALLGLQLVAQLIRLLRGEPTEVAPSETGP